MNNYFKRSIFIFVSLLGLNKGIYAATANFDLPVSIQKATIAIDGNATDWGGIEPIITDAQGDCLAGSGCDIKSVFVAQDENYVYWRIDSHDGYSFTAQDSGWSISFSQTTENRYVNSSNIVDGDINARAWNSGDGVIWDKNGERIAGVEYAVISEIAEGKIPLSFFDSITIKSISAYFFNSMSTYLVSDSNNKAGDITSSLKAQATAQVQNATGQVISATLVDNKTDNTDTVSDVSALVTLENSSSTVTRDDGSIIDVKEKTIALLNPAEQVDIKTNQFVTLVRGEITTTVECKTDTDYTVRTSLAKIVVVNSCNVLQRAANNTKFTSNYAKNGLDATLTVSVISGSVNVTDRLGNSYTVNAGEEKVIQDSVPRSTWVLPIDGDKIYGGKENMLVWTAYPDAVSYKLEYNLPSPVFAQENTSSPEYLDKSFNISEFTSFDDLILFNIPLEKGLNGTKVEARIYALDAQGEIIAGSVSGDKTSVIWTDL